GAAKELLKAYRAAPAPLPRPGMTQDDQQKFIRLSQGARQANEADLIGQKDALVAAGKRDNVPILTYRDGVDRRRPKNGGTFAAALDALFQRTATAADGKNLVKTFCADVKSWAMAPDSPSQTMALLAKTVRRLADTKSPPYYDSVSWRETGVFSWRK